MYKYIKRTMDFVVAFLLLIILSPLMLAAAVCIAANRDGPVLFRQERPGKNGKIFMLYKFRTMTDQRDDKDQLIKIRQVSTAIIGGLAGIKNH